MSRTYGDVMKILYNATNKGLEIRQKNEEEGSRIMNWIISQTEVILDSVRRFYQISGEGIDSPELGYKAPMSPETEELVDEFERWFQGEGLGD